MSSDRLATTIGEICDTFGGEIQTGPFGSQLHAHDYVPDGPVPVVTTTSVGRRRIDANGVPRISRAKADTLSRHYLQDGDIVFARRGVKAAGLSALVEPQHVGWLGGTGIIRLRIPADAVDASYLSFVLSERRVYEWIRQNAIGATMPNLNQDVVRRIPLELPPLPEQRAIADVLGSLDDKIDLNRKMNETLEGMARALFKSWFVDFEPVHAMARGEKPYGMDDATAALFPDSFEESELGPMPRGWAVGPLSDSFNLTMGQSPPGSTYNEDGVGTPMYQGATDFGFRFPTRRKFTSAPKRLAQEGDTLVSVRAPVGRANIATETCCVGRGVAALRHQTSSPGYTYRVAQHLERTFEVYNGEGTVFGSINQKSFRGLHVAVPPDAVVLAYEGLVAAMDARVRCNWEESQTLAEARDSLLPKLLKGELRIAAADRVVGNGA